MHEPEIISVWDEERIREKKDHDDSVETNQKYVVQIRHSH